jgi:hypothetical protein
VLHSGEHKWARRLYGPFASRACWAMPHSVYHTDGGCCVCVDCV